MPLCRGDDEVSPSGDVSADLERVLAPDEELVWHARPDRRSHMVGWLISAVPVLVFFGPFVFMTAMFCVLLVGIAIDAGLAYLIAGILGAMAFTLGLVVGGTYLLARRALAYAEYAVTDRRLIRFGGLIGRDYSTIDRANVEDLEVNVGLVNERFGTGTISATTAGSGGVSFSNVLDPYAVLESVQSLREANAS